jgi:hypothetical protein
VRLARKRQPALRISNKDSAFQQTQIPPKLVWRSHAKLEKELQGNLQNARLPISGGDEAKSGRSNSAKAR